ncbi:MAG TPA: VOC family protein [Mucilaginibacter sp.]|jgi:predicted enzyme related to lactoylglutathione lyase|nr:VOC family protein [Mucilaginibacter sp.]
MKVILTSILVDNQDKALKFYTEVLGFIKKTEFPAGDAKWLTVVSPDSSNDVEILLEPNWNPAIQIDGKLAAGEYQKMLLNAGIPVTTFGVDNTENEYERLKALGVKFTMPPTKMGPVTIAVFDDTCGNLISIAHR